MRRPPVRAFRARIGRYVRGYGRRFLWIGGISVVGGVLEAAVLVTIVPLVQGIASEDGTGQLHALGPFDFSGFTVGQLVGASLALVAARLVVQLILARQRARLNADWDEDLRNRVFNAFVDADWEVQSQEPAAHVQELLTAHLGNSQAILAALSNGWVAFFNLLVLVVAAVVVDPLGAVVIVAFGLGMFAVMRPLSARAQTVNEELSRRNLDYVQTIGDTAHLTREIRTFGVGEAVKTGFADEVSQIRRLRMRGMFLGGALAALYQNVVIAVVLVGLGLVYVIDPSHLTALAVVALVLIRAMAYSQSLHTAYHSLRESGPYLERLTDREVAYSRRPLQSGGVPVEQIASLRFDDVSYTYPATDNDGVAGRVATEALRDLSFAVDRGQLIGIVGPSGSGKSTLVQLLLGLRTPSSGHLLVNGVDATTLRRDEWFHRVSFVPQEPTLFAGTVAENIAFHRPWVDDEVVVEAARRAHLHDDVVGWTDGYETQVGDRGSHVSGGQRQRICIARALVDDPDIIIFDEPTSALDVHSELAIQQTLEELRVDTFLFIVAHRLSTLDTCDQIMVLADGHLQDFAPAADLQVTNPWFAEALELSSLTAGARRDLSPTPPRSAVS